MTAGAAKATAAIALAVLLLPAGCHKQAGPGPNEPLWNDGARYDYLVSLASVTQMGKGNTLIDFKLTGALEIFAGRAEGGGAQLGMRLRDLSVQGTTSNGDAKFADLARELQQPWFVRIQGGHLEAIDLPHGSTAAAAGVERTLAAALQVAPQPAKPPTDGNGWTGVEHDATGRYAAAYAPLGDAGRYSKRKLRYESLLLGVSNAAAGVNLVPGMPGEPPSVIKSAGEIDATGGTLRAVHGQDELTANLAAGAPVTTTTSLKLTLTANDRRAPPSELARPPADYVHLKSADPYAPPAPKLQLDAAKTAGWTFDRAVSELETLEKNPLAAAPPGTGAPERQGPAEDARAQRTANAFMALSAMFRTDPSTIKRASAIVRKNGVVARALMDAMSSSQTAIGQQALLELVEDKSLPATLREAAAGNLIRLEQPTRDTVAGLTQLLGDPLLDTYAAYGLGTFARKLRKAGDAERADQICELLIQRLGEVKSQSDKTTVLRGIANSAYVGAIETVRPYLTGENAFLRAAAVEALRLMDHPEIDGMIAERMRTDKELVARNAALDAARPRPASTVLIAAVQDVAVKAPDAQGRMDAVRLLARWLPQKTAAIKPALEQIAASDKEPKVREQARRALDQRTM